MSELLDRRGFIRLTGAVCLSGGMILLPGKSQAFIPAWLARFLFGRVTRRAATSALRSGSAATRGSTFYGFKNIVELGITGGAILAVSPEIHAMIGKYNAEAIWIDNGVENNFYLQIENKSSEYRQGDITYQLVDVETNKVEVEKYCGFVASKPNDTFKFDFSISELPYRGIKQLRASSSSDDFKAVPSGNIIVAGEDEVMFRNDS